MTHAAGCCRTLLCCLTRGGRAGKACEDRIVVLNCAASPLVAIGLEIALPPQAPRGAYGWRAKIGIIVPPTNTANEPEFYRMAPDGVSVHSARMAVHLDASESGKRQMLDDLGAAVGDLAQASVDVIAYACTVSSMTYPLDELTGAMETRAGVPAVTTAGALLDALHVLGAKRIAMATPYSDEVNEHEKEFLEQHGVGVVAMRGLGLAPSEFRRIATFPPRTALDLAREIDRPEADAVLISCTDFATLDCIAELESDLDKPVVTSNQATFWRCLRAAALPDQLTGFGRLLADF